MPMGMRQKSYMPILIKYEGRLASEFDTYLLSHKDLWWESLLGQVLGGLAGDYTRPKVLFLARIQNYNQGEPLKLNLQKYMAHSGIEPNAFA